MYKSLAMILFSIILVVGGQFCLKLGMNEVGKFTSMSTSSVGRFAVGVVSNPMVILGLFLYGLSALVWLVVLSRVELSFAYPMLGLSYVLVLIISAIVLREDVNLIRWLGAATIVIGVVMISRS